MTSLDLDQARRHVEILRGTPNAMVYWQLFSDAKGESNPPKEYYATVDQMAFTLGQLQQQGYGAYMTVNPTDGQARKVENITNYEWLFADLDGVELPATFPLQPALITGRDSQHTHIYWRIENCLTANEYSMLQRRIALFLGSDIQVIDPARVLRLAGSWQLKDKNDPRQYAIYRDDPSAPVYKPIEIANGFMLPDHIENELQNWISNRQSYDEGTGFNDNPIYIEQAKHYFEKIAKPSGERGSNRSLNLFRVAAYARDRGVRLEVAQQLAWDYFNPRCTPPWTNRKDVDTYVRNSYNHSKNEVGCKTAAASFKGKAMPEPVGGWDANEQVGKESIAAEQENNSSPKTIAYRETPDDFDIGYVSELEGTIQESGLNSKSSPHDMGLFFIGKKYPERKLIRFDGFFYRFDGVSWGLVSDEEIKNEIEKILFSMSLTDAKINNVLAKVASLTYKKGLKFRTWMSDPKREGEYSILENGIMARYDNGDYELLPHNQDYFDLNLTPITYDPTAMCPLFEKFCNDQWGDMPEMLTQVQDLYAYALMGKSKHQIIPIYVGKSRSGKSVHTKLMSHIIGEGNVSSPSLEGIAEDVQLLQMSRSKLAIINEANNVSPANKHKVLDRIKLVSGGDSLTIDRKFKEALTISDWPMIMMVANVLPDFIDGSGAYANRAFPIPFFRSFQGREDPKLLDKLKAEAPGILNWALRATKRIAGYDKPFLAPQSREMIEDIRYDSFPLSQFVSEACRLDYSKITSVEELYDAYIMHCRVTSVKHPMNQRTFTRSMSSSALQITKKRVMHNGQRDYVFYGIELDKERLAALKPKPTGFSNVANIGDAKSKAANG